MSTHNPVEYYQSAHQELSRSRGEAWPGFVRALSHSGMESFALSGFPTTKWENWKYTDVKKIGATEYVHSGLESTATPSEASLKAMIGGAPTGSQVVLVNGVYRAELSDIASTPGLTLMGLREALANRPDEIEPLLGSVGSMADHPFIALNTAFLSDGLYLRVDEGARVPGVLHILHVTGDQNTNVVSHPRLLIVAGPRSEATILESFVGVEGASYFSNAVT